MLNGCIIGRISLRLICIVLLSSHHTISEHFAVHEHHYYYYFHYMLTCARSYNIAFVYYMVNGELLQAHIRPSESGESINIYMYIDFYSTQQRCCRASI